MNLAVIIGMANYLNLNKLPACINDAENMLSLVKATGKYDSILTSQDLKADDLKNSLRDFFKNVLDYGKPIDEVFFYFSGHGTYKDDLHLCCVDYIQTKNSTTSISNTEIDDLIRSVSPKTAVKILDACQSGAPYIKDVSTILKNISSKELNSFVCMASSNRDQSSYATSNESFFTASWINAALSKESGSVLYRDIQSELADVFSNNQLQTPFFVTQGSGLEEFCKINPDISALKAKRFNSAPQAPVVTHKDVEAITQKIKDLEKNYVKKERAFEILKKIKEAIEKENIKDIVLQSIYKKDIDFSLKLDEIPKSADVASFADRNNWNEKYFVKINKISRKRAVKPNIWSSITGNIIFNEDPFETVVSISPSDGDLQYQGVVINFKSEYSAISKFRIYFAFVYSKTELVIISTSVRLFDKDWDSLTFDEAAIKWKYKTIPWPILEKDIKSSFEEEFSLAEDMMKKYIDSFSVGEDDSKSKKKS